MTVEIFHPKAPAIFYFITCLLSCFNLCNIMYIYFKFYQYIIKINFLKKIALFFLKFQISNVLKPVSIFG